MLISTMDAEEVALEVKRDYQKLADTTIMRLGEEYERERKKYKISRERAYTKVYTVKTARKNNWIIVIGKSPSAEIYTNRSHLNYEAVTYYWDDEGLKVLQWRGKGVLQIYKGHVFTRYNMRMKLGLDKPVDIIKHYFMHNRYCCGDSIIKKPGIYFIGFAKDGLLLGQAGFIPGKEKEQDVLIWRTFVSRDLIRHHQEKKEKARIKEMEQEALKSLVEKKDHGTSYLSQVNVLKVLTGKYDIH